MVSTEARPQPGTVDESRPPLPGAYWRQWTASAISNLGDGINFVAMPLLALSLTSDERLLSLTVFATFVPWLLLALPVGVVVDRLDRRSLMIAANLVRLVVFGGIAMAAVDGRLHIWVLIGLLVVVGSCEVLFDSTAQAFLPMLVEPHQLARANGLLFAAEIVAGSLAGLAVGALLFDASPGLPFGANAVSFAIAAGLIATIRPRRTAGDTGPGLGDRRLRAGFHWLRQHTLLKTLAAMFTVTNLGLMFGQGIFVKYAIDELGLGGLEFGLLLAITAMGAASGGLVGHRVIAALGLRTTVVVPYIVFGLAQVVIGLTSTVWVVGAAGFLLGSAITIWNVVTVTIRQREIPPDRFGRVNAVYRWLGAAASALGVAAGGFVAYATNLRAPFLVGGAITLVAAVLFARPVLANLDDR
ncbi:MFS transporter [Ilumatobacter sp.]|uniref:MFS transporter n=1 Tax=Ilumatobacter sp. TaxID=1967498 RepID=UPI003AF7BCF6